MGKRLLTKSPRTNAKGQMLVSFAANRTDGVQTSAIAISDTNGHCIPFESCINVLGDRKHVTVTFQTDTVWLGATGVSTTNGYPSVGVQRGGSGTLPPATHKYSNRKQFLRGQYLAVSLLPSVAVCARAPIAIETVAALELS